MGWNLLSVRSVLPMAVALFVEITGRLFPIELSGWLWPPLQSGWPGTWATHYSARFLPCIRLARQITSCSWKNGSRPAWHWMPDEAA